MLGWPAIFSALFAAAFLSAGTGLVLLAARRVGMRSYIPFGPFLVAGAVLVLLSRRAGAARRSLRRRRHSTGPAPAATLRAMHPALQRRRRHLMMTRRTTRRGGRRRGLATFLLVTLGVFGLMFAGSILGTAGGMLAAYNYFASDLPEPRVLDGIEPQRVDRTSTTAPGSSCWPASNARTARRSPSTTLPDVGLAGDRRQRGPDLLGEQRRRLPGHRARRARQPGGRRDRAGRLHHHPAGDRLRPRAGRGGTGHRGRSGRARPGERRRDRPRRAGDRCGGRSARPTSASRPRRATRPTSRTRSARTSWPCRSPRPIPGAPARSRSSRPT